MSREIPDFLLEMSKQMNEQDCRSTAHPFWQVRCKNFIVTESGYDEHHYELIDDDGSFYRSDSDESANGAIKDRYPGFVKNWESEEGENFLECFDAEWTSRCVAVTLAVRPALQRG